MTSVPLRGSPLFAVGLALVGGLAALAGAATGHGRVAVQDAHGDDDGDEPS